MTIPGATGTGWLMRERGWSLVEVVVVIGIMSILLAIGTLKFGDWAKRYRQEAQTRTIYTELLKARASAVSTRRTTRVKVYPERFEVYSTNCDDLAGAAPLRSYQLRFPIRCNASSGDDDSGHPIEFDAGGLANLSCSICLEENGSNTGVDSVVISDTRVSIGKRNPGKECNSSDNANITFR